jgi:hypothetical protein
VGPQGRNIILGAVERVVQFLSLHPSPDVVVTLDDLPRHSCLVLLCLDVKLPLGAAPATAYEL